jgi:hypothetical protein
VIPAGLNHNARLTDLLKALSKQMANAKAISQDEPGFFKRDFVNVNY